MNNTSNLVKQNARVKEKKIARDRNSLKIQKIVNRIGLSFVFLVFGVFVWALGYMYFYQSIQEVATTVDFVIASIAILVLVVSNLKNRGKFKKKKYLWYSTTYILLMTIGLVVAMLVGISFQKVGELARLLSLLGLVLTILIELIDATITDYKFYRKGEIKQEHKIEKEQKESVMSFGTKSKE